MNVNPPYLQSYDIRGIYPTDLNEQAAYLIGRAFVTFLGIEKVVVGRDMRLSGPSMFKEVTRGITEQGADVIDIGWSAPINIILPVKSWACPASWSLHRTTPKSITASRW